MGVARVHVAGPSLLLGMLTAVTCVPSRRAGQQSHGRCRRAGASRRCDARCDRPIRDRSRSSSSPLQRSTTPSKIAVVRGAGTSTQPRHRVVRPSVVADALRARSRLAIGTPTAPLVARPIVPDGRSIRQTRPVAPQAQAARRRSRKLSDRDRTSSRVTARQPRSRSTTAGTRRPPGALRSERRHVLPRAARVYRQNALFSGSLSGRRTRRCCGSTIAPSSARSTRQVSEGGCDGRFAQSPGTERAGSRTRDDRDDHAR